MTQQMGVGRLFVATCVAGALLLPAARVSAFSSTDKARILYVGDSLAAETLNTVTWFTQITGKAVLSSSIFPGLALCDFLDGKPAGMAPADKLRARVRTFRPHLVILQFWGNGFTQCMAGIGVGTEAYYNQYFWDSLNAVLQIEAGAADAGIPRPKILWVLQGPDAGNRDRPRRLNDGYAFVAALESDRTSDAGWNVSMAAYPYPNAPHDRYQWTQYLPCTDLERQIGYCTLPQAFGGVTQLHKNNDGVHFCLGNTFLFFDCDANSPGILRYGMRIAADANTWLGL